MFGDRMFVLAADQKLEHLDDDFVGKNISEESSDPEHFFRIADEGSVDLLATHLGLITRHGEKYRNINYLAKLNGKSNLINPDVDDPQSALLWTVDDVLSVAEELDLSIPAVGYTIFLGSSYESVMLREAAQVVMDAKRSGLLAFLWIYAKGASVEDAFDPAVVAGAAGVGHVLGADFVKVYAPAAPNAEESGRLLRRAVNAAGNTGVICAGGARTTVDTLVENVWHQMQNGASGVAIGRNIFQRSLADAAKICHAIKAVVHENALLDEALMMCR